MKKTRGKVPAGPKAQPTKAIGNGASQFHGSSTKKAKARGIDPGNPRYGILDTTRKHTSAVTQPSGRNVPTGQKLIQGKVPRQAY